MVGQIYRLAAAPAIALLVLLIVVCMQSAHAVDGSFAPISLAGHSRQVVRQPRGQIILAQSEGSVVPSEEKGKQSPASISGSIKNYSGENPIANAHIVLTQIGAEHKRLETDTASDGTFSLSGLEPGDWTLTISAEDMLSESRKITLTTGESKTVRVALEEAEATDVLRITGKRTLIHPENVGSTTNLDHTFINEYRSGNNLQTLINSTPGVLPDSYGNIIVRGEHNAINYTLDGVVLPEAAGVLQQSQFVSPRSLQSMQVDIGGYQASDGGGPLGAVVRMKSLPITPKPTLSIGGQLGGPLAGNIYFNTSGAFSQNPNSILHKLRFEASGASIGTTLGLSPPTRAFRRNGRWELNYLGKLEFQATERDTFRLTALVNESFSQIPTSPISFAAGVRMKQHDREDMLILSYRHRFDKWFDELNLHLINGIYSQKLTSHNVFDPNPILNGEEGAINSVAPYAKRFNYIFGAQGDISKTIKTHKFTAGFLTEVRPVSTKFNAFYYNANPRATFTGIAEANAEKYQILQEAQAAATEAQQAAFDEAIAGGASPAQANAAGIAALQATLAEGQAAADAVNSNPLPYASPISPFTGLPGGPVFQGSVGNYRGFRYLQSAFLQDQWRPTRGWLKRLTVDAGVRFDLYHGVFGNTMNIAETIATIPDVAPFLLGPFQTQKVTNAQASGRFGLAYVLTKNTVIRGSFSNIFQPPPVDVFAIPPEVEDPINGIFNGTVRPLRATTGYLVDTSIEQQIGPRFVTRTNLYYKRLKNFGDSGVIANTPIYNRLSLAAQEAYGIETRVDLKPARDGYGFNGYLSNTIAVAKLRGCKCVTGGIYEVEDEPITRLFPDHDRRYVLSSGLGYKSRHNWWVLGDVSVMTGLTDSRDPTVFGVHPARTPVRTNLALSAGYQMPQKLRNDKWFIPQSVDVRIENMLNQRIPINLGSPFQGTRFSLPIRVLAGMNWKIL